VPGEGVHGQSDGIPTRDERLKTLSLDVIIGHAERFTEFVRQRPEMSSQMTAVGGGLAVLKRVQQ
jgi:hypothetical protein